MKRFQNSKHIFTLGLVFALIFLASCMPQRATTEIDSANSTTNNTNSTGSTNYPSPSFPLNRIFFQNGSVQTDTQFALAINFTDSFLVRGNDLSSFLRTIPNTTRFCLVSKFTYSTGIDRFLILAAKPKSYTDLVNKTTEYYLQVEPANDQSNQNDCLTYNLTNSIFTNASSPIANFSLTQVCTNCTSTVTSEGFKLYFNNGEAVQTLNLSSIVLSLSGSISSSTNSCVESSVCIARGFNCCLDGQCVTDGAVKPGALAMSGFNQAQIDVASNPNRFVVYPQYYFVCAQRPEGNGTVTNNDPIDPAYDANIRLMELKQLHQCLNKIDGEFSYCTAKFTSASQKIAAGSPFSPGELGQYEDINFQNLNPNFASGDYANNITKIFYAGQVLFEANKKPLNSADGLFTTLGNDDLTTAQKVKITKTLPVTALDDNLYLTFKVDGSCEKIGSSLARCSKNYIQDHSDPFSVSYHDSTKEFSLPSYADTSTSSNIIVKVSGIVVPEDITTWSKAQSPNRIIFSASYPLYQNQSIDITYYVNSNVSTFMSAKIAAQAKVNTMCLCSSAGKCNLRPILDDHDVVTNYECTQGTTADVIPVNQTAYVSNKNIPHRYFDLNGVNYDGDYSTAPDQEGTPFSYINNNLLKPSNLDTYTGYTGFNEIYGSFSKTNSMSAKPAKMLKVKKDQVYDIFANSGVFSTCITCGSDYYSSIQRIFPQALNAIGGGYSPDKFASSRISGNGSYRSDDLLFGRACFIPATMIPWSHNAASSVKSQRQSRLAAQHFLFANGYARDWFGFDYGSLIGSFDGVTWFSIGNQRRIKATSGRLFLAVNAYFGDQNLDNNFNVTVSETTMYSPEMPDHDTETTGGECQRSHFCSNDNDCFSQLGYDYTCQNISTLTTRWPQFDANGNEVVGSITKSLASILGGTNGQTKRCVYRGRGAACHANLASVGNTFNGSTVAGHLACSSNSVCQTFSPSNSPRFNDRISRFANTPVSQNLSSVSPTPSDIVGLGARIIGRPFDFYGTQSAPNLAMTSLVANNVSAVCIPGKSVSGSTTTYDLNSTFPLSRIESSDKLFGVGTTMSNSMSVKYLNACPATDTTGAIVQQTLASLGSSNINLYTTTQNLSTNLLDLPQITSQNVFSSTAGSQITTIGYQRNTCLRAPGASCFSDMDCAPSEFIASKVKAATLTGILNPAEEKFWEEELICGNPEFKYLQAGVLNDVTFDLKKNVCCRDFGKTITVATQDNSSDHHWCNTATSTIKVAGINTLINSYNRYSRVHTVYDKTTCDVNAVDSTKSFALSLDATTPAARYGQLTTQFKTLDAVNSRTCCTQNWVRNFASENGGGHTWASNKAQTIDKTIFKAINWNANYTTSTGENATPYLCDPNSYTVESCEMRDFTDAEITLYSKFFGSLELIGIPQAAIMTEDQVFKINDGTTGAAVAPGTPIDKTINPVGSPAAADFVDSSANNLFSGKNTAAFTSNLKKVFSEDEFSCCIPSGQQVPLTTTSEQCCTGNIDTDQTTAIRRCCLPAYTDLTVYLSRYVSSEGRGYPDSAYDPDTGYIKDTGLVELIAARKGLCCSGKFAKGVAIRRLPIPMSSGNYVNQSDAWTRRFTYLSNSVDNNNDFGPIGELFDNGVRWNDHVYCLPTGVTIPPEK